MLSGSGVYYCIYLRSKQDEEASLTSGFYFEGKVVKEWLVVGSEGGTLVCKQAILGGRDATKTCSQPLDAAGMLTLFPERRWRKLGGC